MSSENSELKKKDIKVHFIRLKTGSKKGDTSANNTEYQIAVMPCKAREETQWR